MHEFLDNSKQTPIPDLLDSMRHTINTKKNLDLNQWYDEICPTLRPHPNGLQALFPSKQISMTPSGEYIEPLLTPMRHPNYCLHGFTRPDLFRIDYLIHDFESMCRQLKPTSRRIFIDMGASLAYHEMKKMIDAKEKKDGVIEEPIFALWELYESFWVSI